MIVVGSICGAPTSSVTRSGITYVTAVDAGSATAAAGGGDSGPGPAGAGSGCRIGPPTEDGIEAFANHHARDGAVRREEGAAEVESDRFTGGQGDDR